MLEAESQGQVDSLWKVTTPGGGGGAVDAARTAEGLRHRRLDSGSEKAQERVGPSGLRDVTWVSPAPGLPLNGFHTHPLHLRKARWQFESETVSTNIARRHHISPRPAFEVGRWPGRRNYPQEAGPAARRSRARRAPLAAPALEPAGLGGPGFFIQNQLCRDLPPAREEFPHHRRHRKATFGQGLGLFSLGNHLPPARAWGPSLWPGRRWKTKDSVSFPPGSKAILAQPVKNGFLPWNASLSLEDARSGRQVWVWEEAPV